MKSLHQTSAPSTPNVSSAPAKISKPRLIFRCAHAPSFEKAGVFLAEAPGFDEVVMIGRKQEAKA
jgi:hypothetical protein